jgi:hypothetical protein
MALSRKTKLNVAQVHIDPDIPNGFKNKQFYVDMALMFARWYVEEAESIQEAFE